MLTLWSDIDRAFFGYPISNIIFNRKFNTNLEKNELFSDNSRMNLSDKGDFFEFVAELPGLALEDIDLNVRANTLSLSAKRSTQKEADATTHLCERQDFEVKRSVSLPVSIDTSKVEAKLKDGVLRVQLPKAPEHQPRKISIQQ